MEERKMQLPDEISNQIIEYFTLNKNLENPLFEFVKEIELVNKIFEWKDRNTVDVV